MNGGSDDSPAQWSRSAANTPPPKDARTETLIIGDAPPAVRGRRRPYERPRRKDNTVPGPVRHLRVLLTVVAGAALVLAGLVAIAVGTGSEWRRCPSHDAAQTDIEQLRQLSEAEHGALVAADTNRLETLLAADFTLVTPDAQTLTRDDLIAAVRSGDLDFQAFRFHEVSPGDAIEVRLDCDIATVSYRSEMDVTSGLFHYRHDSRHTDTWVRAGRSWQEIRAQTTAVGGFPPPGQ